MHESQPGGPGGEFRPYPGRADQADQPDQPDRRPGDDWFRPPRGQSREPGPRNLPAVYGGRHNLPANRPPNLPANLPVNRPRFNPFLRVTSVDLMALTVREERKPGRNWALIVGTVFFFADTILMAEGFTRPVATEARVLVIFIWLISVAAVLLLWLRGSPKFSGFLNHFSSFLNLRQSAPSRSAHNRSAHSRSAHSRRAH
jgi:hypothetical protein